MNHKLILGLIAAAGISVTAQTIKLSGKVTNQNGKPVSGAIVTLVNKQLKDTTDASGAYSITTSTVSALTTGDYVNIDRISMTGNALSVSLTSPAPVKIELFDMNGHLIEKKQSPVTASGNYHFNLSATTRAVNMLTIRVTMGNQTSTFRYISMNNGTGAGGMVTTIQTSNGTSQKLLKIQSTLDSLKVSASGYITAAKAISSYTSDLNFTLNTITLPKFSFFVTSQKVLEELSKNKDGFGGDFRFGKTGQGAGLLGADSICSCIAEKSMPGSSVKIWRAFLSVSKDKDGKQVNAADRIGKGPWYDRTGRLLAPTLTDLLNTRPMNGDVTIKNDLPNEDGVPNHYPNGVKVDNHHMVTGSNNKGILYSATATCNDWTSTTYATGKPQCGFAWPRTTTGTYSWITGFSANGCEAGVETIDNGGGVRGTKIIGSGGGYGGFYCFALNP